jgi:hypothetical protein
MLLGVPEALLPAVRAVTTEETLARLIEWVPQDCVDGLILLADGQAIDPTNSMAYQQLARKMYGGCRVNAAVKPWLQDNKHGRGIRCDLIAVQFAADDKPFGEGAVDASNLFGAVAGAPAGMFSPTAAMPAAPFAGLPSFLTGH